MDWIVVTQTMEPVVVVSFQQGPAGPTGPPGDTGTDGASAYEVWLAAGNAGTEEDFLDSLVGPTGAQGAPGADGAEGEQGPPGNNGTDGLSAYQVWLAAGNAGTEEDFLDSLIGPIGEQGAPGADGAEGEQGPPGTTLVAVFRQRLAAASSGPPIVADAWIPHLMTNLNGNVPGAALGADGAAGGMSLPAGTYFVRTSATVGGQGTAFPDPLYIAHSTRLTVDESLITDGQGYSYLGINGGGVATFDSEYTTHGCGWITLTEQTIIFLESLCSIDIQMGGVTGTVDRDTAVVEWWKVG